MKAFKAFIKPFEVPQRSVKIKIQLNFFTLSGFGTLTVKRGMIIIIIDYNIRKFETWLPLDISHLLLL